MAIAISTYAAGSIADYSDLIAEIRDMMDDADYSDAVIARAMRKAEGEFNSLLRVPDMETRATLAVTDGFAALPSDYSQLRFVRTLGDYPATLPNITAGEMGDGFAYPYGYSIEGREIRVVPAKTASISFTYYQKIPPLSEAIPANWLLTKHPSLYVAAILHHLAGREVDRQARAERQQEILGLIDIINAEGRKARWGAGPLVPVGIRQVNSARA